MDTFSTFDYISNNQLPRNKISLEQNLVSFVEQGEKVVYFANQKTTIANNQFAILSLGNCLMTEKLPFDNCYRSTMLFFDNSALSSFFLKYTSIIEKISSGQDTVKKPFLVFEKDEFIQSYITSLKLIKLKSSPFKKKILALKFEELLLHLLEKHPSEILSFQTNISVYSDIEIRKAVELNLTDNLKLDELAFLCNVSVSTFKRKFIKLYNETPSRYFLQQKMQIAKSLLIHNENPSEVYYKVGYENHSSFSQSFKQMFGISPKQFKKQHLTDSKQVLNDKQ